MKTLVTIHCYAGDEGRVKAFMPWHERLGHDVCILCPEDKPITFLPAVRLGKAAYIGQESINRQDAHLQFLAAQPYDFFLLNDSDSLVITKEIPPIVYTDDVLWSNEVCDPRTHPTSLPRLAFQPPYFMSKKVLQALADICPWVQMNQITPYIDHYMMQLCYEAIVRHRPFENPAFAHPVKSVDGIKRFQDALDLRR